MNMRAFQLILGFWVMGFSGVAHSECRVAVAMDDQQGEVLAQILNSKGYHVVPESRLAHEVIAVVGSQVAWDNGPGNFSYAVPRVESGLLRDTPSTCPAFNIWSMLCVKPVFHKRQAINCSIEKVRQLLPISKE